VGPGQGVVMLCSNSCCAKLRQHDNTLTPARGTRVGMQGRGQLGENCANAMSPIPHSHTLFSGRANRRRTLPDLCTWFSGRTHKSDVFNGLNWADTLAQIRV